MKLPTGSWRWAALAGCWVLLVASGWVILVQLLFLIFQPRGRWQRPHLAKVIVERVSRDQDGKITGQVIATEGEEERELLMWPQEAVELHAGQEVWILDNYWVDGIRPNHYRATPWRLVAEYPEGILLISVLGIVFIRRRQKADAKAALEAPNPNRKVWKDEFHTRAERFAKKESVDPSQD